MFKIKTEKLNSFLPGNPFLQDAVSVGFNLGDMALNDDLKKYMVMSNGFKKNSVYIVNVETGERVKLIFEND